MIFDNATARRVAAAIFLIGSANACSNLLITPGASADGSSMISYNADSGTLYGSLYHYPASNNANGTMRKVWDWDSGAYLGEIPEAEETYNVVGNINEFGLSIGETTFGGVDFGEQTEALIDYGSLIWITLQRSKTAREAVMTAGELMAKYGYASEGESFSIADSTEVWIMEIVGKGPGNLGAVWVARKIPDGYVSGHANQARITTFPLDDPETCLYSDDAISFARDQGLFAGNDEDFSFSDAYDPVDFEGARFCEGRVWTFFGNVTSKAFADQYEDYASGYNLTNRMPLWVQPAEKITLADVERHMRNTFQGTSLDMAVDVGAGGYKSGQRAHPLTWAAPSHPGAEYLNERPIGTQQTGWNFVASLRPGMPDALKGVLWFGVDDSSTTARFPVYGCSEGTPAGWGGPGAQDGVVPPMMTFDMGQAFTVFNLVANLAYTRWSDAKPLIEAAAKDSTEAFVEALAASDESLSAFTAGADVKGAATAFSVEAGESLLKAWTSLFGELFLRFRDGYTITKDDSDASCGCKVANGEYAGDWYDRIVDDTGDHLKVVTTETAAAAAPSPRTVGAPGGKALPVRRKRDLKALR